MYRPVQQGNSIKPIFFGQKNYDTLQTVLIQDFQQRNGAPLDDQQIERLSKTLDHYIGQIYQIQGEKPIQTLNKEALTATAKDFSKYLQRKELTRGTVPVKTVMDESLFQETSQRFERLTQDRNEVKALPPAVPDFHISLNEDGPPASEMFERAKKQREMEALRNAQQSTEMVKADLGLHQRINADTMFRSQQESHNRVNDMALVQRQMTPRENPTNMPLVVMPDRRELLLAPIGTFDTMTGSPMPRDLGIANSNPTIIQPELASPLKNDLPQHYLVREEKIVSYREIENNLFIYSADRDWLKPTKENRYHFTVNFDVGDNNMRSNGTLKTENKFKNIVRIELVKAILPGEGLDVRVVCTQNPVTNSTTYQDNILSFPYITLQVQELENNNYGTDNFLDRSFGVLQYDANWVSDTTQPDTRGYIAMIPKFLKCQKEYYPTPLSTLQKMTINLLRPNGDLISNAPDTFDITSILAGTWTGGVFPSPYNINLAPSNYDSSGAATGGTSACNYFINTATYFSRFQVCKGDRIQIAGYTYDDTALNNSASLRDFVNWINNEEGHIVIDVGNMSTGAYADGLNSVGYANFIVIQARYEDPTTGSTLIKPFEMSVGVDVIGTTLQETYVDILEPRKLIDLNKQISLVFRVITREMDSMPQLRPDNTF